MAIVQYSLLSPNTVGGPERASGFWASDATSDADAKTVAQSYSTMFAVTVTLVKLGSATPIGTYTAGSQGSTVSTPSNVRLL